MPMVDVDGISLYYTVKGEGTPIVFIHPPLLTSANFRYQIEELSQRFKVITFDIRGHGRSSYSVQPITYPLIVEDIKRLLDHLRIPKAFLCGYSTGGSIVLEFLLTFPEIALGGIVISGMSEVGDWYLKKRVSFARILVKAGAVRFLASAISWGNANKQVMFKELFKEALKGDARNIEQYYRYCLQYNCTSRLTSIYFPILLVYGTKDKSFHGYANLLHEKLPSSELKFLPKEKHQLPTKAAKQLNRLIKQFINSPGK
ncbi:MAG: alpha/beta hydrolase [Bacillus sp. (in: Bacteria)]|nr:alpha/beta hydrolase [Bacillus sp. (in: firmicutes)]